ncbi:hypothetical protein K8R43_00460 [archaeon]|nr:hypothetical protein [archaeon]
MITGLEGILGSTPTLIGMAIAVFVLIVFAEYGKVRKKAERGFGLFAAGGMMFFLAATFNLEVLSIISNQGALYGQYLFQAFGLIFVFVGTIWASVDLSKVKK